MSTTDFLSLIKDTGAINQAFTITQVRSILNYVQNLETDSTDSDVCLCLDLIRIQIVFSEFFEALACISLYRDPNPYSPLSKKIAAFLAKDLFPPLMMRVRGLSKISFDVTS